MCGGGGDEVVDDDGDRGDGDDDDEDYGDIDDVDDEMVVVLITTMSMINAC